jgi:uncharacterized protein YhbP (UPF0306 family)
MCIDSNTEKARRIISTNNYLCLATCDQDGNPWVAPLYYAFDDDYNFYFVSAADAVHTTHIVKNRRVAFAIYDSRDPVGEGDGVQIEAEAHIAKITELPHVLAVYFMRRFPHELERIKHHHFPTEYIDGTMFRFIKVVPRHIYTLDLSIKDLDRRIEVSLLNTAHKPESD